MFLFILSILGILYVLLFSCQITTVVSDGNCGLIFKAQLMIIYCWFFGKLSSTDVYGKLCNIGDVNFTYDEIWFTFICLIPLSYLATNITSYLLYNIYNVLQLGRHQRFKKWLL